MNDPPGTLAFPVVGRILQENKDKSPLLTVRIIIKESNVFLEILPGYSGTASSDGYNPTGISVDDGTTARTSREYNIYKLRRIRMG